MTTKEKRTEPPFTKIIRFKKHRGLTNTYDVELNNIHKLNKFCSIECHIVIYPYSRKISSNDFAVYPFEEYVKDIQSHQRSAYAKISNSMNNYFGLFMGLLITLVFFFLKRADLYSIESIVSVFGAYILGKELWDDIENFMINLTKTWRLRYIERYYSYQLEKQTTLTHYSYLAKKQRYGKSSLMPEKMDFIEQSNSKTIRMFFNITDIKPATDDSAHILSIHIDPRIVKEFEKQGYMLGVKISFNIKRFLFLRCYEFFQSINGDSLGCLDEKSQWVPDTVFSRNTLLAGRIKFFINTKQIKNRRIITD